MIKKKHFFLYQQKLQTLEYMYIHSIAKRRYYSEILKHALCHFIHHKWPVITNLKQVQATNELKKQFCYKKQQCCPTHTLYDTVKMNQHVIVIYEWKFLNSERNQKRKKKAIFHISLVSLLFSALHKTFPGVC
jgi:hypothetical protein